MAATDAQSHGKLERSVGFYGLMFVSLGSIIGSGWLLSALTAAVLSAGWLRRAARVEEPRPASVRSRR